MLDQPCGVYAVEDERADTGATVFAPDAAGPGPGLAP